MESEKVQVQDRRPCRKPPSLLERQLLIILCSSLGRHANMELCLRFPEGATGNACRRWKEKLRTVAQSVVAESCVLPVDCLLVLFEEPEETLPMPAEEKQTDASVSGHRS